MGLITSVRLAVIGTDTGVGKTAVTVLLAQGLRELGRRVWLHKPVACGGWDGSSSEDGRALRAACTDGQDPATVCPLEFPEPCSPHLAAQAAGVAITLDALCGRAAALAGRADVLMETAGGLLAPLTTARESNADLLAALGWPVLLVTRPHLGTLNHTQLTVNECRRRGLRVIGLVVNQHAPGTGSLAERRAADELVDLCRLPVLSTLPFQPDAAEARRLAQAVLPAAA